MNQPLENLDDMSGFVLNQEKMHYESSTGSIYAVGIMTPQISLGYFKIRYVKTIMQSIPLSTGATLSSWLKTANSLPEFPWHICIIFCI